MEVIGSIFELVLIGFIALAVFKFYWYCFKAVIAFLYEITK